MNMKYESDITVFVSLKRAVIEILLSVLGGYEMFDGKCGGVCVTVTLLEGVKWGEHFPERFLAAPLPVCLPPPKHEFRV